MIEDKDKDFFKKISFTEFESVYEYSEKVGNRTHGEYVRHNIDVFNYMIIGENKFFCSYQTGVGYEYNDYDCPTTDLEYSEHAGGHDFVTLLDSLYESDFDNEEYILEKAKEATEFCPEIENSPSRLFLVYEKFNDNKPNVNDFVHEDMIQMQEEDEYNEEIEGIYK